MTTTIDRDALFPLDLSDLAPELAAELDADGFEAFSAREFDGDLLTGRTIQIAWHAGSGRAGLVLAGSGSSGVTAWTDAASPEDALRRYLDDDLRP